MYVQSYLRWPYWQVTFQVYVNSYIALLNAPYHLQPKNLSELRPHHNRPTLHSGGSEAESLRKDTFKHSHDHDDRAHPLQAVKVSSCILVDRQGLNNVLATATCFSDNGYKYFLVSLMDCMAWIDHCLCISSQPNKSSCKTKKSTMSQFSRSNKVCSWTCRYGTQRI
jgi:hypothetical protein